MTDEDRELGRLEGEMAAMKVQISELGQDLEAVKADVHEIKVMMAEMRTELRLQAKRQSSLEPIFSFMLMGACGAGIWFGKIEAWHAGIGVIVAALVLQRASLGRVLAGYFNRGKAEESKSDVA